MRLLGIDTSTPDCSAALLKHTTLISQNNRLSQAPGPNPALLLVDDLLSSNQMTLDDVDGFVLTTGPGSFTGLRVGLSLMSGFVLATEKPFVGINTLRAMARTVSSESLPICAVLDARKREVYFGIYKQENGNLVSLVPESVVSPQDLCDHITGPTLFLGNGLETYGTLFKETLGERLQTSQSLSTYSIAAGATLLAQPHFERDKSYDLNTLKIDYLRKSEAELNFKG